MRPNSDHLRAAAPRPWEMVAGCVLGLFGVFLGAIAAFVSYKLLIRGTVDAGPLIFLTVLWAVCVLCVITAVRLVRGRTARSDGGLFAPWILSLFGCVFLLALLVAIFQPDGELAPIGILLTLTCGSFALAFQRRRAKEGALGSNHDT